MKDGAMMNGRYKNSKLFAVLLSYLTVLGLATRMALQDMSGNWLELLLTAVGGFSVSQLLLFAGLCFFYHYMLDYVAVIRWSARDRACVMLPAGLFAAFMVVGYSFAAKGSLELVLGNSLQKVKSIVMWNGYFIAFSISIAALYTWLSMTRMWQKDELEVSGKGLWKRYQRALCVHPFWTAFLTLLICYLPCMILSYPGVLMGDNLNMILQGFNLPDETSMSVNLIDEAVKLNGHHPIIYTVLLHLGMMAGKILFGSYNIGVFLTALLQALIQFAAMSAVVAQLVRLKLRPSIAIGLLAYFIVAPRIQNYTFLITKDVLGTAFLLLFVLFLFRILASGESNAKDMVGCCLAGIAFCLFRNEGKYIILASLVIMMFLLPRKRRQLGISGVAILLVVTLFFQGLMPALRITSGGKQEMLSVPFQQTARYLRDHGSEVTEEERDAIAAVLDYDTLAERYQPELSDKVKATYNKWVTGQELATYFKVWFQMGLKHPGTYIQATMNNYYSYFYPGTRLANRYSYEWSGHIMQLVNERMTQNNLELRLNYPQALSRWRQDYETLREKIFELPVLSLLKSPAAYVWGLILLAFYAVKRREEYAVALLLPLLFTLGVCLLGPTNGTYFRYLYGISVALPPVFFLSKYLGEVKDVATLEEAGE